LAALADTHDAAPCVGLPPSRGRPGSTRESKPRSLDGGPIRLQRIGIIAVMADIRTCRALVDELRAAFAAKPGALNETVSKILSRVNFVQPGAGGCVGGMALSFDSRHVVRCGAALPANLAPSASARSHRCRPATCWPWRPTSPCSSTAGRVGRKCAKRRSADVADESPPAVRSPPHRHSEDDTTTVWARCLEGELRIVRVADDAKHAEIGAIDIAAASVFVGNKVAQRFGGSAHRPDPQTARGRAIWAFTGP
jgi:hypothetical protein